MINNIITLFHRLSIICLGGLILFVYPSCNKSCPDPVSGCHPYCTAEYDSKCESGICDCIGTEPEYYRFASEIENEPICKHISRFEDNTWKVISDECGYFENALFFFELYSYRTMYMRFYLRDSINRLISVGSTGDTSYEEQSNGQITFHFFEQLSEPPFSKYFDGQRILGFFEVQIDSDSLMMVDVNVSLEDPPYTNLNRCKVIMTKLK